MGADRLPRSGLAVVIVAGLLGVAIGTVAAVLGGDQRRDAEPPPPTPSVRTPAATPGSFWTVVVASIRQETPDASAEADRAARRLRDAGLETAVLDSSAYDSLEAGFLVVYSGRFPDRAAAEAHLDRVRSTGAGDAYVRDVRRS